MSKNSDLLDYLKEHADQKFTEEELRAAVLPGTSSKEVTRTLWMIRRMSVIKFKERHVSGGSQLYDIQYRPRQTVDREQVLFELAVDQSLTRPEINPEDERMALLREAAALLERANEITLAILVLDAAEGKQRDLSLYAPHTARRPMVYLPGEGRPIRELSVEEADAFWKSGD